GNSGQHVQKALRSVDTSNIEMQIIAKHGQHFFELVLSQQSSVDEDADQSVPDCTRYESGRYRRIHAAADGAERPSITDLFANPVDRILDKRTDCPIPGAAADIENESTQ